MNVLFLNPPYTRSIVRRYGCSFNSPGYLFPPLELCSMAAAARAWNGAEVSVLDAVAERMGPDGVVSRVKKESPDLLVFLPGFESFHEDMKTVDRIRSQTGIQTACIGYLPTLFPDETVAKSNVDYVIMGEPEHTLSDLISCIEGSKPPEGVRGLCWRGGGASGRIVKNPPRPRMKSVDGLPVPDRGLLNNRLYSMPFFGRPFTTIQTSRGCPFPCTYCTHFEGHGLSYRSPEKVIEELKDVRSRGIGHIRFMDNNFTHPPQRAKEICRRIIEERLDIRWACLSRADLFDREMVALMQRAGCKMVFLGIESGSQRTLNRYNKGYTINDVKNKMKLLNGTRMEKTGWFIVGAPWEERDDLEKTIGLAKSLGLDYAIASVLSPHPGTRLFSEYGGQVNFSLFPYDASFKDAELRKRQVAWEKEFYRRFYMRPRCMARFMARNLLRPREWAGLGKAMLSYIYGSAEGDFF